MFRSDNLSEVFEQTFQKIQIEVESIDPERLLNTSSSDLSDYLNAKYEIEYLTLLPDQKTMQPHEAMVDIQDDPFRDVDEQRGPFYIPGLKIDIEIPFEGNANLFYASSNHTLLTHSTGIVKGNVLVLSYTLASDEQSDDLKNDIDRRITQIQTQIGWVNEEVKKFNTTLKSTVEGFIKNRKERILSNKAKLESIGIPLKKRETSSGAISIPKIRKKVIPVMPKASVGEYQPEPRIEMEVYESILGTMQSLALGIERTPSAYRRMKEEEIRDHLLVFLNGNFEGTATAETFNQSGHTDILIREKDRNVFIAECKFWKGPKTFQDTINQLLGYVAWRDSKTAILVFA